MQDYSVLPDMTADIRRMASECGFADVGIARMELGEDRSRLEEWLRDGLNGDMKYMERHTDLRASPQQLRSGTLSVISVRMNYLPDDVEQTEKILRERDTAYIARYALGRDYHRVMRKRLLKLGQAMEAKVGPHGYRVFTDSAPVFERALARNAGLGVIGKNTMLLQRRIGSFFLLGEIYSDLPLEPSPAAERDLCGACKACLDVCPTRAFTGPYRLDARRCISYLTIESRDAIPVELRPQIGNRIFGCDDCQLVCPWNRFAKRADVGDFAPRNGLEAAKLVDLFAWNEDQWSQKTEGMALRRATYRGWLRNLAVALGNAPASAATQEALEQRADHPDSMVREHVSWALAKQAENR